MINLNFLYLYSCIEEHRNNITAHNYLKMQAFTESEPQNLKNYYQGILSERVDLVVDEDGSQINNIDKFLLLLEQMGGDVNSFLDAIATTTNGQNVVDKLFYSFFPNSRIFGAINEVRERGNIAFFQEAKTTEQEPYSVISEPEYLLRIPTKTFGYKGLYDALSMMKVKNKDGEETNLNPAQITALCLVVMQEKDKRLDVKSLPVYLIDNYVKAVGILDEQINKVGQDRLKEMRAALYLHLYNEVFGSNNNWDLHEDCFDGLLSIDKNGEKYNFDLNKTLMYPLQDILKEKEAIVVKEKMPQEKHFKLTKESVSQFRNEIVGQEVAKNTIVDKLLASSCGFKSPDKPIGTFMLSGPTGVGKTETAKAVARNFFNGNIYTIDMTNFKHSGDVSILTGSAPGYVGYDDKNAFIDFLKENPQCVLLFDEIDKAAADCLTFLMRILDEGKFTTAKGEVIDVSQCVVMATTNQVANIKKDSANKNLEELSAHSGEAGSPFLNEFMGRFDAIIDYEELSNDDLKSILRQKLDKKIADFKTQSSYDVELSYNEDLLDSILKDARVLVTGARGLHGSIQNKFVRPVAYYLLENELCSTIEVGAKGLLVVDGKEIQGVKEVKEEKQKPQTAERLTYFG